MVKLKRSDLETWDKVDPIKLIDAAQLWVGERPALGQTDIVGPAYGTIGGSLPSNTADSYKKS